jgi:hypothetical protein
MQVVRVMIVGILAALFVACGAFALALFAIPPPAINVIQAPQEPKPAAGTVPANSEPRDKQADGAPPFEPARTDGSSASAGALTRSADEGRNGRRRAIYVERGKQNWRKELDRLIREDVYR